MSNKSGVAEQVISTPTGGGAVAGIGETFSPDLFTGTGNFTVPIDLPSGRNDFQPELTLAYSTGNGNGPLGLGWGISIPGVSRKTSEGVPVYNEDDDTFILSGAEDLIPVKQVESQGETLPSTQYRPRTEGTFARINHHVAEKTDHWEVESKDGSMSTYGTPMVVGADPAAVADPARRENVFTWNLTETVDPFGNHIEYDYLRDTGDDGQHHWDQLYPKHIRYVDYGEEDSPQYLVSVTFEYEERPDPFSRYRAGFEIRTRKRCTSIEIKTHTDEERLVRSYDLIYLDEQKPQAQLPPNEVSQLSRMEVIGHGDDGKTQRLPGLDFGYTQFEPKEREFAPLNGDLPTRSLANPDLELADLFGNGLPDIIQMNDTVRYWRNLGGGEFDEPRPMTRAPAGIHLADAGVQLMDADGDGRIDLLTHSDDLSGYFPLQRDGGWADESFQRYEAAPSVDFTDPESALVDLDGDGVTDLIRSGSRFECFFNDPKNGWKETRRIPRRSLEAFPNVNFSDPRVRWADLSGDGLQDIVFVHDGNIEYWPNLGYGNWGRRQHMRDSPRFPYNYHPEHVLFGDIDGDGLADLIHVEDDRVTLWINQSGNGWSDPIEIDGTPSITDVDAVRIVDMFGNGIGGLLWTVDARIDRANMYFLDFSGEIKPYLLDEMDNNMGAITRVGYAPSTEFYLADEAADDGWDTTLPSPTWVVAKVEAIDAISEGKLTTEYHYHHGYWDGAEREFRGFGLVEQLDTETFKEYNTSGLHGREVGFDRIGEDADREQFSPPTLTKTWFHQGPIGNEHGDWQESDYTDAYWSKDPRILSWPESTRALLKQLPRRDRRDAVRALRGSTLRKEVYALDDSEREDRPYEVTETQYGIREESPPDDSWSPRRRIFFPYTVGKRVTRWERGDDPQTRFTFTSEYDEYGQARSQTAIACPRGWSLTTKSNEYLATHTETTYAQRDDEHYYIVNRTAKQSTYEVTNTSQRTVFELKDAVQKGQATLQIIGQTLQFYDGPQFEGLDLEEIGTYGALVRSEELVLTEEILQKAYPTGDSPPDTSGVPLYLDADEPTWSDEYPEPFRTQLQPTNSLARRQSQSERAGYIYCDGSTSALGYFTVTEQNKYDFQTTGPSPKKRGLHKAKRGPLGNETQIAYGKYDFLPTEVTDSTGLVTTAEYDYRFLKLQLLTDPNGNRTQYDFTPLGLVEAVAQLGKANREEGDTPEQPSKRFTYDIRAFERSPADDPEPAYVHTIEREQHRWVLVQNENEERAERGAPELTTTEIEALFEDEVEKHPERFIQTREYSDGFERVVQTRIQAEDMVFGDDSTFGNEVLSPDQSVDDQELIPVDELGDDERRVRVNGWKTYNNKGSVVETYEPFFGSGWEYLSQKKAAAIRPGTFGRKVETYYDALERETRAVNSDGSESRIVRGIPVTIDDPDVFEPVPWEVYEYDANDNAGRTHDTAANDYRHHWNTPTSKTVDALGREIETIERNREAGETRVGAIETHRTVQEYDIRGNVLTIVDALRREAFTYVYDLADNKLRTESLDAGVEYGVLDAAGNQIEARDGKGAVNLQSYGVLNRPTHQWTRDSENTPVTLRQRVIYGDAPDSTLQPSDARRNNLQGTIYKTYDEAGLVTFTGYDFNGNPLEKYRQVLSDDAVLSLPVDWDFSENVPPEYRENSPLAEEQYCTSMKYDALNRITKTNYPKDVTDDRKELRVAYNRAGSLRHVELVHEAETADERTDTYVDRIAYNATGQRTLIAYGNGVLTRYAYDNKTFRLKRLRTDTYTHSGPNVYRLSSGDALQDFGYGYDLVGNIREMHDQTPNCGVRDTATGKHKLDRTFEYDALNRLTIATGREAKDMPNPRPWIDNQPGGDPHVYSLPDVNRTNAPNHTSLYTEEYSYDAAGNMTTMKHRGDGTQSWTRQFGMSGFAPGDWDPTGGNWQVTPSNRLTHVGDSSSLSDPTHEYDAVGNLVREKNSRYTWDHANRLRSFKETATNGRTSVTATYVYDAAGQRVKKVVEKETKQEVTVYVDGIFEYRRVETTSERKENNTLHVMDNETRVALIRIGNSLDTADTTSAVKYHISDYLDSSVLVIDGNGDWMDYEEYFPYGETAFGGFARKRYRYTGKERDEESNLCYYSARYYAPWLCRWTTTDPAGPIDSLNPYQYVRANPMRRTDPGGTQDRDEVQGNAPTFQFKIDSGGNVTFGEQSMERVDNLTLNPNLELSSREGKGSGGTESSTLRAEAAINASGAISNNVPSTARTASTAGSAGEVGSEVDLHHNFAAQAWEADRAMAQSTVTEFENGNYGWAATAFLLEVANEGNILYGEAANLVVGGPWNIGVTLGEGITESDPKKIAIGSVGMGLLCVPILGKMRNATGPFVHLTDEAAAASINSSRAIYGSSGIYAGPVSNANASGLGITLRTGIKSSQSSVVRIPARASGPFVRPIPVGPFTGWQRATGQVYTASGLLDLQTGTFYRTGFNWNQAIFYGTDLTVTGTMTWLAW